MSIKDLWKSFNDTFRQGPLKDEDGDKEKVSSLTNGGFTGYHPRANEDSVRRGRKRAVRSEYQQPLQQGIYEFPNQPSAGVQQAQQAGPGTQYVPQPQGYGTQFSQQPVGYGTQPGAGYVQSANGYASQPQQPGQQENISYIHSEFADKGTGYRHIERLAQLSSTASCYRVIEFMRNGESVIVNVDGIQDDREKQRCLDLLYGAAFTMQCTFTRVAAKSIYLIAPKSVQVIQFDYFRQLNEQDSASRWPGSSQEAAAPRSSAASHGVYPPYAVGERYSRR